MTAPAHLHQRIRADIEGRIRSGAWPPGHRIPSELAMTVEYGCSRMTVSKVLSALAVQGLITRRRRAGSMVAAPTSDFAVMQIQDFVIEAARSGKRYEHKIVRRVVATIDREAGMRLGLTPGAPVLMVDTLHLFEGIPQAFEKRIINLATVPSARAEAFESLPPGTWLLQRVPWSDAEHVIHAVNADAALRNRLKVAAGSACLVLERRTWQNGLLLTEARLFYPGRQHRLVGRFSPTGNAAFRFPDSPAEAI